MKKCIIIHGCPDDSSDKTYNQHWLPWLTNELQESWIETFLPNFHEPRVPDYNIFKNEFEKYIIDSETVLIWHSCGWAFLVRWLSENNIKFEKLILVAPWKDTKSDNKVKQDYYTFDINVDKSLILDWVDIFTSNTEVQKWKDFAKLYHKSLGWNIISLDNHGHFTFWDMWKTDFPELFESIMD